MASAPIRQVVAEHLVDVLAGHELLGGVQVEDGYPGELAAAGPELVWVAEIANVEVAIPVGTGGTKVYDDRFAVRLSIRVAGRPNRRATARRLAEIHRGIHQVLATDATLDDLDGVLSAEITDRRSTVGSPTPDGHLGFGLVVVTVHSRIGP